MTSIRLPEELERDLEYLSRQKKASKSAIIKEALTEYIKLHNSSVMPYELGKDLFGRYGSERGDDSTEYKQRLQGKLREKFPH